MRREIHEGLNVVENWNSANDFIFYVERGEFTTNQVDDQELGVLALHLLQICLVYVNTLFIQEVSLPKQSLDLSSQNSQYQDEFQETDVSIVIDDPRLEQLAQELAAAEGTTVESVVRESLMSRAGRRGLTVATDRPLRDRLAELAREIDTLPPKVPADSRTAEAVLGYDDHGQW